MGLPTVDACCYCIDLYTGVIIIGIIQLVYGIIGMIVVFVVLGLMTARILNVHYEQLGDDNSTAKPGHHGGRDVMSNLHIIISCILAFLLYLFFIICGYLLLNGATKDNDDHLETWIALTQIFLIVSLIVLIIRVVLFFLLWEYYFVWDHLLMTLLEIYFLIIVTSYYD